MAQISLRVDDEIKHKAEKTLDEIGLSMSTAINIFLKTVVRENRIPFELTADPFYSKYNIEELERRVANIRSGKSTLKEHELIEEDEWENYGEMRLGKNILKKINRLLMDIDRNGYQCIGKPEPLSGNLQGYWSVRIDEKNRIVFRIENNNIEIIQCGTHYRDK